MNTPSLEFGQVTVYLGEKNGKYPDGNQVVVRGSDTKVIFDTPLVANNLKPELEGTDMVILGHVHEDHTAGIHLLPDSLVLAHEADVNAIRSMDGLLSHYGLPPELNAQMTQFVTDEFFFQPRPDARSYHSEQVWDVGRSTITALHMPGHTGGHSALLVEPEGVLFIGDIDLSGFGPYYGDGCSNLQDFRRSLARLKEIEAKAWVTSHHKGVITDRETFLDMLRAFAAKIDEREAAILKVIGENPMTLDELVTHRFVYPTWYDGLWAESCEIYTITRHLEEMLGNGSVLEENGLYRLAV
ncbi:MAG: MBL fold metallo-hydrolase [Gammaproteobacteria bacterium]|nr:MAG: MBL fold metallo-hydrolase [Gammaproteobacteria bacterium]